MSKYAVKYQSGSKGPIEIETMANPHLANALRKLEAEIEGYVVADLDSEDAQYACAAAVAIREELESRGCSFDVETDRWVFPEKEGAKP